MCCLYRVIDDKIIDVVEVALAVSSSTRKIEVNSVVIRHTCAYDNTTISK